jgi:hypothetical protein
MSLYTDLVSEGVPVSNWQSDLYCLDNELSRSLVKKHGLQYEVFISNIDGKLWLSIPFQFDPFWQGKNK